MPTIRPFRSVNEHDVINLYRYSGDVTTPLSKGTFVKVIGSGWVSNLTDLEMLGSPGASYANTVSQRYGVPAQVTIAASGDTAIGMTLYDVRETDENGEKLIYNPTKKAELQAILSGEAVPILTRGIVLYSGIDGNPTVGGTAYVSGGQISVGGAGFTLGACGRFLGKKDSNGWALVRIDL